jgi:hypothetical protein
LHDIVARQLQIDRLLAPFSHRIRASGGKASHRLYNRSSAMNPEPARARPIFSTADFALLKEAVADYTRKIADDPRSVQFANLYHRLGRLG